jgi:hypothetical protein
LILYRHQSRYGWATEALPWAGLATADGATGDIRLDVTVNRHLQYFGTEETGIDQFTDQHLPEPQRFKIVKE